MFSIIRTVGVVLVIALIAGCATAPRSEAAREELLNAGTDALRQMKATDPTLEPFMKEAYGYAIFPEVGKGGLGLGGAYGRGVVYEQGEFVGYSDITQATIGLQAGGQAFRELVVFQNQAAMDRFKSGRFAFSANASAVALKTGAAGAAGYTDGVAVFVEPIGGLMFEVSIGGQQFTYQPK